MKNKIKYVALLFTMVFYKYLVPRKKYIINKNSKKIAYIGHSYHAKTNSTGFLIHLLQEFYDVEVILDESWSGKGEKYPDLSSIDQSYLAVIFFQNLPDREILNNINNNNIIYFPMYDQSGREGYDYWCKYRDIKIVNFANTLHKNLTKWGFNSIYIQYFPKPPEFTPGNKNEVFFWQRRTKLDINIVSKLFNTDVKIHIHKAIDPNQKFIEPGIVDEKRFEITYSDWFETKEEMLDVIKQKGIYIAPREYEGIGLSFLEAMAMGKAVIATDNPTMNEYIKNGETGYLFDVNDPRAIDLSDIEKVQKNTYEYIKEGYRQWERRKHKIIHFIEME